MSPDGYYRRYDPDLRAIVMEKNQATFLPGLLLLPLVLLIGLSALLLFGYEKKTDDQPNIVDDGTIYGIGGGPPITSTPTPSPSPVPELEYIPLVPD